MFDTSFFHKTGALFLMISLGFLVGKESLGGKPKEPALSSGIGPKKLSLWSSEHNYNTPGSPESEQRTQPRLDLKGTGPSGQKGPQL